MNTTSLPRSSTSGRFPVIALVLASLLVTALPLSAEEGKDTKQDASITQQIKKSLLFHLSLNTKVQTADGVVTLTGMADDGTEKELATKLATKTPGVVSVVNNVVVPVTLAGNNR